jgi:hypothetical protein
MLPIFGDNKTCSYKNCGQPAVAQGKQGKRYVCLEHVKKQFGADVIEKAHENRSKNWKLVDESPNSPYP